MDFLEDDEPRPRFLVQSRAGANADVDVDPDANALLKTSRTHASLCLLSSLVLLLSALLLPSISETLAFLLSWSSLSLLLAPFAPPHLTGGDVRVGLGPPLPDPSPDPSPAEKPKPRRRSRPQRPDPPPAVADYLPPERPDRVGVEEAEMAAEEQDWDEADLEILRKQMAKLSVGTARRWELIAAAFGGRHGVRSVIATAKAMTERRPAAGDSFTEFLRKRKLLDGRVEGGAIDGDSVGDGVHRPENGTVAVDQGGKWSSGEDLALLNALKAFPKDTALRWEKIAAAVPGRSKVCCMKRVAELKKDFRSSKAAES